MINNKKYISLILVYHHNPEYSDGGSISMFETARWLQEQGENVCVYTFIRYDPAPAYEPRFLEALGKNIGISHKIIPFTGKDMGKSYHQNVLKLVTDTIKKSETNYAVTCDSDFISLISVSVSGIPGAHFFRSLSNIAIYTNNYYYIKLLQKRTVFTASEFLKEQAKQLLGIKAETWLPIPRFYDRPVLQARNQDNIRNGIGYYSSGKAKGDDIISAVIEKMPDRRFVIMGGAYSFCRPFPENVEYIGEVSDVGKFYRKINLLLAPSIVKEGLSRVILEAHFNGIPVVANAIGGIPEAMGDTGILIDMDVPGEFFIHKMADKYASAIDRILNDDATYAAYSRKAWERSRIYQTKQNKISLDLYRRYIA